MLNIDIYAIFLSLMIIKISSEKFTVIGKKIQEKRQVVEAFHNLGVRAIHFKVKG